MIYKLIFIYKFKLQKLVI